MLKAATMLADSLKAWMAWGTGGSEVDMGEAEGTLYEGGDAGGTEMAVTVELVLCWLRAAAVSLSSLSSSA